MKSLKTINSNKSWKFPSKMEVFYWLKICLKRLIQVLNKSLQKLYLKSKEYTKSKSEIKVSNTTQILDYSSQQK
jgi:hypothetical protein